MYLIDGQYLASRLSKTITKESDALKKLLKEYNELVQESEKLTWTEVTDLSSSIYSISHEDSISMVPRSVRLEAIKYHFLSIHAQEEISLLKNEMKNVVDYYVNGRLALLQCIDETDNAGSICLLKRELWRIENELKLICTAYAPYITVPSDLLVDVIDSNSQELDHINGSGVYNALYMYMYIIDADSNEESHTDIEADDNWSVYNSSGILHNTLPQCLSILDYFR